MDTPIHCNSLLVPSTEEIKHATPMFKIDGCDDGNNALIPLLLYCLISMTIHVILLAVRAKLANAAS